MPRRARRTVSAAMIPLLAACAGTPRAASGGPLPPAGCGKPAPLLGRHDPAAPGFIVVFHREIDAGAESARLAAEYGFQPRHVYRFALRGFSAELSETAVEALRCEDSVRFVEYDGLAPNTRALAGA